MARCSNENRKKAYEIFKQHNGKVSSSKIAELLNEKVSNINYWRRQDKWSVKNKGGAPKGNLNNFKHGHYCDASKFLDKGFLAKYIPTATKGIIKGVVNEGISTIDMLWDSIILLYSSIIRSQKIMHVESKEEMIKEIKKSKVKNKQRETEKTNTEESEEEYEYEFQFAWDRQATFIKSQTTAFRELNNLIKQYEELLHKNWKLATEEQKLRIKKLKVEVDKISGNDDKGPIKIEFVKASERNE